jgi:hypothetical protein
MRRWYSLATIHATRATSSTPSISANRIGPASIPMGGSEWRKGSVRRPSVAPERKADQANREPDMSRLPRCWRSPRALVIPRNHCPSADSWMSSSDPACREPSGRTGSIENPRKTLYFLKQRVAIPGATLGDRDRNARLRKPGTGAGTGGGRGAVEKGASAGQYRWPTRASAAQRDNGGSGATGSREWWCPSGRFRRDCGTGG